LPKTASSRLYEVLTKPRYTLFRKALQSLLDQGTEIPENKIMLVLELIDQCTTTIDEKVLVQLLDE
ncbi:hypothetical protein ABK046_51115, partial [Streptomyces caeruleatus]